MIGDFISAIWKHRYCIVCERRFKEFKPFGVSSDFFKTHNIIGGGFRENCQCIRCGTIDRGRWQYYVLKKHSGILEKECSVLHFAPEKANARLIRTNTQCNYVTVDITPGRADYVADITNMLQFSDNSFDYVIANHVLEHISDEAKAFSEIIF